MKIFVSLFIAACLTSPVAHAQSPTLEQRVKTLETELGEMKKTLATAVQMNAKISLKTANGLADSCLASKSTDSTSMHDDAFLTKCKSPNAGDIGLRNWLIQAAQQ